MKATQAEIVDVLLGQANTFLENYDARQKLADRIQQHGIAVDYVPMSDDDFYKIYCELYPDPDCRLLIKPPASIYWQQDRLVEATILNRLGVAPTLAQAKQICEANGFSVVPSACLITLRLIIKPSSKPKRK